MGDYRGLNVRRDRGGCCPPMDLMRSEAMQLVRIIVPVESAHLTLSYLGDLGLFQFKDVCRIFNALLVQLAVVLWFPSVLCRIMNVPISDSVGGMGSPL
ncbi:hypothetical protein BHE74_00034600 [Ensete ventricosum]|nr:hypothetical protein BHE74_00034600 [Ensete ventricosum]RZR91803.1 hypothetical protein BHM03_00019985 [Ensete ventricosum]